MFWRMEQFSPQSLSDTNHWPSLAWRKADHRLQWENGVWDDNICRRLRLDLFVKQTFVIWRNREYRYCQKPPRNCKQKTVLIFVDRFVNAEKKWEKMQQVFCLKHPNVSFSPDKFYIQKISKHFASEKNPFCASLSNKGLIPAPQKCIISKETNIVPEKYSPKTKSDEKKS